MVTETQDTEANRIIYLFKGTGKKTFILHSKNKNIIECSQCGGAGVGDPFQGIEIAKNGFIIYIMYGACIKDSITITFTYNAKKSDWFLSKYITTTAFCNDADKNGNVKIATKEDKSDYGRVTFNNYNN